MRTKIPQGLLAIHQDLKPNSEQMRKQGYLDLLRILHIGAGTSWAVVAEEELLRRLNRGHKWQRKTIRGTECDRCGTWKHHRPPRYCLGYVHGGGAA